MSIPVYDIMDVIKIRKRDNSLLRRLIRRNLDVHTDVEHERRFDKIVCSIFLTHNIRICRVICSHKINDNGSVSNDDLCMYELCVAKLIRCNLLLT